MANEMKGWTKAERKAAQELAQRTGTTAEDVAKKAMEKHRLLSHRGALYRADILG